MSFPCVITRTVGYWIILRIAPSIQAVLYNLFVYHGKQVSTETIICSSTLVSTLHDTYSMKTSVNLVVRMDTRHR